MDSPRLRGQRSPSCQRQEAIEMKINEILTQYHCQGFSNSIDGLLHQLVELVKNAR